MFTRPGFAVLLLATLGPLALRAQSPPADAAAWKYVVPAAGEPLEHPPLVPLALFDKRPELVTKEPAYGGVKLLYGLLRYGSDTSPQVVVVLNEREGGQFDLYVDAARDPEIAADQ